MRHHLTVLILLVSVLSVGRAESEFQAWQRVTIPNFDWGKLSVSTFTELEWHEGLSQIKALTVTEHFQYKAWEHTSFALGTSYLEFSPKDSDTTSQRLRLEPEVLHTIPLDDHFQLLLRNRFEIRWIEGVDGLSNRTRHLVGFKIPLPESFEPWVAFTAYNDFHYDLRADQYNKNWLVPASFSFQLNEHLNLSLFYLMETCDSPSGWQTAHVLGTHLVVKF